MSVILDALKKLEREKAAQRSGPVDIVPEITGSRRHDGVSRSWKLPAAMAGAVAVTAVATMAAMHFLVPSYRQPAADVPERANITQPMRPLPPAAEQAGAMERETETVASPPVAARTAAETVLPPVQPVKEGVSRVPAPGAVTLTETGVEDAPATGVAPPSLKVSGIAWQEKKADRRAVVNGVLAGEGTVVEGVRIERIFPERVRFSRQGRSFDVAITGPSHVDRP